MMPSQLEFVVESVFAMGLFVNAALFVPQIVELYSTKNSHGLSFATFAGFNVIQLFTILHGYIHSDRLLIIGNLLSLISCGMVTVMIVVYRRRRHSFRR